jgi:hypothetical protein
VDAIAELYAQARNDDHSFTKVRNGRKFVYEKPDKKSSQQTLSEFMEQGQLLLHLSKGTGAYIPQQSTIPSKKDELIHNPPKRQRSE